ncbi:MAG: RDD family protein [Acidimicrobiales bacterium]
MDSLPTPASVRHRLFARVMDAITLTWLLGFVLVEIDQRLLGGDPFGRQPLQIDITEGRSLVFVIVTIAAYEVIPTVWRGATLGKALLGLRIQTIEPQASMPWIRTSARALVRSGARALKRSNLFFRPTAAGSTIESLAPSSSRSRGRHRRDRHRRS